MPPVLNLEDAIPSTKTLVPRPKLTRAGPTSRTRQLTPRSGTSRSLFSPPSTPAHSPPQAFSDENVVEEKQEEEEESRSAQGENRARTGTFISEEGSILTLDENFYDTVRSPPLENKPDVRESTSERRLYLFGYALPHWWTSRPSRRQVSSFIVKYAPCFWCNKSSRLAMTSRSIALRLILLCAIFGLVQAASASYLLVVLFSGKIVNRYSDYVYQDDGGDSFLNLWNVNAWIIFAGLVGTFIFFVMIFTRKAIAEVNFGCSLRFMWFMLWAIPLEIYAVVGMFDITRVSEVWIRHWWIFSSMAFFRWKFCADNTYNTYCVVPIDGLPEFDNATDWCWGNFESYACSDIQDAAQGSMQTYSYIYYNANGAIGVFYIILLSLTVHLVQGMITKPVVQKNRENHIAGWLILPIVACCAIGSSMLFCSSSVTSAYNIWPGVVMFATTFFYLIAAILGYMISSLPILNNRDKNAKLAALTVFIGIIILAMLSMAVVFTYSVFLAVKVLPYDFDNRGEIACRIGGETCSFCGSDDVETECPEWTEDDLDRVYRSELKHVATLAVILMVYSVGPLRFGFDFRKHISTYEIDYV